MTKWYEVNRVEGIGIQTICKLKRGVKIIARKLIDE